MVAAIMTLTGIASGRGLSARIGRADAASTAASADSQDNPQAYFDHARKLGFPASGQATPYLLRAEFTTRASSGVVTTGTYTDTWVSDKQWRREAVLGSSRFVRSRNGKKWYRLNDGPDAALLQFVLTAMEPLPQMTGTSLNWKMQRNLTGGVGATRVWRGKMNAGGTPDPTDFEAYWFDAGGQLTKSYLNGLEITRQNFEAFNGVQVARQLQVNVTGKVGMKITVTELHPLGTVDSKIFKIKGNDWLREYTTEAR